MKRQETVLLVEDDWPDGARQDMPATEGGCRILGTSSIEEAVHLARSEQPDIIFVNIRRVERRAREFLRLLRGDPRTAGIPTIAV